MVERRVNDGRRIAQLLASEVTGRTDGPFGPLAVVDAQDVEGSTAGEFAYGVDCGDIRIANVYVHENRARVEIGTSVADVAAAAKEHDLRTRPTATDPPRVIVFVESGADVKSVRDVLATATGG